MYYRFIATDGNFYTGTLTTRRGVHRMQDLIEVYYLPENPAQHTVKGSWKSYGFLIFMIAIALWVLYMMYKLYQMVNAEIA